jgi:hypothetical protein
VRPRAGHFPFPCCERAKGANCQENACIPFFNGTSSSLKEIARVKVGAENALKFF